MSAPTPGPLAIIDRELTFLDQRIEKYQRKADIYARKIGARSAPADALVERTRQRKRDLLQARNGILELRDAAAKARDYIGSRRLPVVDYGSVVHLNSPEAMKGIRVMEHLQTALAPLFPPGGELQVQESGWAEPHEHTELDCVAIANRAQEAIGRGVYPSTVKAVLEAAGITRISGEPGGRST